MLDFQGKFKVKKVFNQIIVRVKLLKVYFFLSANAPIISFWQSFNNTNDFSSNHFMETHLIQILSLEVRNLSLFFSYISQRPY